MHFHHAELWEVSMYLLVQHQTDQPICNALHFQIKYLETFEDMKNKVKQESANWQADNWHWPSSHYLALATYCELASGMTESTADETGADNDTRGDAAFFDHLDALWHQEKGNIDVEDTLQDLFDGNDVT